MLRWCVTDGCPWGLGPARVQVTTEGRKEEHGEAGSRMAHGSAAVCSRLRLVWGGGIGPRRRLLGICRLRLWRGTGCCHRLFLHQLGLILPRLRWVDQDPVDEAEVLRLHGTHVAIPFHHALYKSDRNVLPFTTNITLQAAVVLEHVQTYRWSPATARCVWRRYCWSVFSASGSLQPG